MKKILLGVAVVVLFGIGGGAWWLYSSLDSLVASAIRQYGPEITGVSVKLASVSIKPADGSATLRGLALGNPPGFKTERALSLGEISMTLDIGSLTRDVILIKDISIIRPDVTYEHAAGGSNLDVIQRHVEKYVAAKAGGKSDAKDKGPGKKFIIEHVYLKDAKAEVSAEILKGKTVSVPVPNLHLTDIGKKTNGATAGEAVKQIFGAITASVTKAASSVFSGVVDGVKKGAGAVGDSIKGLFK
jgi:hypothetical protein